MEMDSQVELAPFDGRRIQELVAERGLTNVAVAAGVGAAKCSVTRWIQGQAVPEPKFLVGLARVLKVEPGDLYRVAPDRRDLTYYRIVAGYSLAQLGPLAGTSAVHLGRMEAGRRPIPEHLVPRLSELLDLDAEAFTAAVARIRRRQPGPPRRRAPRRTDRRAYMRPLAS